MAAQTATFGPPLPTVNPKSDELTKLTAPYSTSARTTKHGAQYIKPNLFEYLQHAYFAQGTLLRHMEKSKTTAIGLLVIYTRGGSKCDQLGTLLISLHDWHVERICHYAIEGADLDSAPFEYGNTEMVENTAALGAKLRDDMHEAVIRYDEVVVGGHDFSVAMKNLVAVGAWPWPIVIEQIDSMWYWRAVFHKAFGGAIEDALEPFGYNYPRDWFLNPAHACLASADVMRLRLAVTYARRKEEFPASKPPELPKMPLCKSPDPWRNRRNFTHEGVEAMVLEEQRNKEEEQRNKEKVLKEGALAATKHIRDANLQAQKSTTPQSTPPSSILGKRTQDDPEESQQKKKKTGTDGDETGDKDEDEPEGSQLKLGRYTVSQPKHKNTGNEEDKTGDQDEGDSATTSSTPLPATGGL